MSKIVGDNLIAPMAVALIFSALAAEPERVGAEERGFSPEWLATYSDQYLSGLRQPASQDTVFWAIAYPGSSGNRYLTINSNSGMVVLIFTSPYRLFSYTEHHADLPTPFRTVGWSAATCLDRLREIRRTGVRLYALDRSPSCPRFSAVAIDDVTTSSDLLAQWYASRAASNTVGRKYYQAALSMIEGGDFRSPVETLTELVSCVVPEEPRVWVLLGACGVAQGRDDLIQPAVDALRWLEPRLGERLSEVAARESRASVEDRLEDARHIAKTVADTRIKVLQP